jgi:outer membrane protein assembly factor BamB
MWQFKTNGKIFSSPALWNNTVYIGSGDSCLYAIDAASGVQHWKFQTQGVINSSPAVSGEMVYFGSYDGSFYALNAFTGDVRWTFTTKGEQHFRLQGIFGWRPSTMMMDDVFDFYSSSPVVYNGKVYFGCGDSTLYALDSQSGTVKWTFKTGGVIHSSPAACNGKIICGSWDRNMYCLDAETGTEIWRYTTGADPSWMMAGIIASPAISNNTVYFGTRDAHFYAIDLASGLKKWSLENGNAWIQATAAIIDSAVYFGTSDNTLVRAVNARTGKTLSFTIDAKTYVYSSPIVTDSVLYYGTFSGAIHAADRHTGNELWKFQTEASKQNSASILVNGRIDWYALCPGMDLYEYSTSIYGIERLMKLGCILSTPVINEGILYFGSADSCIYALTSTGTNNLKNDQGLMSPQSIPAEIHANYPNPFNPTTEIGYQITQYGLVTMKISDVLGREVKTIVNEFKTPGSYTATWDGKDANGARLSSGVYLCTLRTADFQKSIKMLLMQ